jgi:tRNA(His) 5'-end guanylyltransferase
VLLAFPEWAIKKMNYFVQFILSFDKWQCEVFTDNTLQELFGCYPNNDYVNVLANVNYWLLWGKGVQVIFITIFTL